MAVSRKEQADLKRIQELVASFDPSVMELDPSNENDALTIILAGALFAAMKNSGDLTITAKDDDGRTETVTVQSMGASSNGEPVVVVSIDSSDGTLAPETADLAASLMAGSHQAEVNHLVGE
jgi:hypothetical protein